MSRRQVLRGFGTALSLPLLDAMGPSAFGGAKDPAEMQNPVRLCYLYLPNGAEPRSFEPSKVSDQGGLLDLGNWLSPLEKHKSNLLILRRAWTPRGKRLSRNASGVNLPSYVLWTTAQASATTTIVKLGAGTARFSKSSSKRKRPYTISRAPGSRLSASEGE